MAKNKDLFDDSVMSFGEHLEILRKHLIRALLGLAVGVVVTMGFGESIVRIIRQPIDSALNRYSQAAKKPNVQDDVKGFNFWTTFWSGMKNQFMPPDLPDDPDAESKLSAVDAAALQRVVTMELKAYDLLNQLHEVAPEQFAAPTDDLKDKTLLVNASSDDFAGLRKAIKKIDDPITLNVQEAFMTYIKVSLISGLILTSPWVFYQLWLFVAAGLYPHEQKYIYTYLPMSIGLFLGGAIFCFYGVFPTMLNFLLGFNQRMQITAQIRISEWINFAVMMPLLFGVSFQLPLIMLFLQKINIFQVKDYREKRRLAILAIALAAMLLTPTPDPMSMMLMMGPMLALYELGIGLCILTKSPDELQSPAPA
ncbi:MAG: twin-arginine translocase subunit TatC [Planctomycetaceae bacterium]|nr:twin-arginine translocase subunit TatC [Planctomycetaceae bacterium]